MYRYRAVNWAQLYGIIALQVGEWRHQQRLCGMELVAVFAPAFAWGWRCRHRNLCRLVRNLPKAELHCHLDGSMRDRTFLELYRTRRSRTQDDDGVDFNTTADVRNELCFRVGWDLPRCLRCFTTTLKVLQTGAALERVALELCEDLAADGVVYAEIRYCPSLHRGEGLSDVQIVAHVGVALERASARVRSPEGKPCRFYQIITALRDLGPNEAHKMVDLAVSMGRAHRVVGVDLAGNEYAHPPELFAEAFRGAHRAGLGVTVHAGEGSTAQAARNVRTAVEVLGATRVGHGVAADTDPGVVALLRERAICVECCPTSNVHTGSIAHVAQHPAPRFLRAGLRLAPCADNTLLSATRTSDEYLALAQAGLNVKELRAVAAASLRAGFAMSHEP